MSETYKNKEISENSTKEKIEVVIPISKEEIQRKMKEKGLLPEK